MIKSNEIVLFFSGWFLNVVRTAVFEQYKEEGKRIDL